MMVGEPPTPSTPSTRTPSTTEDEKEDDVKNEKEELGSGPEKRATLRTSSGLFVRGVLTQRLQKLRRQLEWYFTDANLSTDHCLYRKISDALPEGGWLCCSFLIQCRRIQELKATPQLIVASLQSSHLETMIATSARDLLSGCPLEARRVFVRRRQPLPPLLTKECRRANGEVPPDAEKFVLQDRFRTMNRLKDQTRVQAQLRLKEIGNDDTVFRERVMEDGGTATTAGPVIAVGYERIMYGDHGPYVEVSQEQVRWDAWPHFFDKKWYANSYYDEFYTVASHKSWIWARQQRVGYKGILMLYAQQYSVDDRPWAPGASGEQSHAWRATGYADYRPGYFYFAADETMISVEAPPECVWPAEGGHPDK